MAHQQRQRALLPTYCLALALVLVSDVLTHEQAAAELAATLAQSGNDPVAEQYQPAQGISGRVTIVGSDTMQPLMTKLAAAFRSFQRAISWPSQMMRTECCSPSFRT